MKYTKTNMKTLKDYIIESLNEAKKVLAYTNEELLQIAKNYSNEYSKLMIGTEDEDAHAYLKPDNFKGKFFQAIDLNTQRAMMMVSAVQEDIIESLANACPELVVIFKTYEAIDTTSRIRNLVRSYYQLCLPSTGMLFNSIKEAKDYIKEHPNIKFKNGGKKVKCVPMTCKDAFNEYKQRNGNYREFGPIGKGLALYE